MPMATSEMLSEIPLFALLDDDERAAVAAALESRQYAHEAVIFNEGEPGDEIFIVHSGTVEVFTISDTGQRITLDRTMCGDVFGEISLLDAGPRTATAVADGSAEVLVLDRDALQKVVQRYPHVALDLLSVMGRRIRATDALLRTQVSRNVNIEAEEQLTFGQRVADKVAAFGGSWTFIITFGVALATWVAINTVALHDKGFDPYPYILLNLFLSMLAALQAPVIMMSQNRQATKDRLKSDLDYEVNLKAELEIAQLHRKLDAVTERVAAMGAKPR
jgi:uncharacterized membrane protein